MANIDLELIRASLARNSGQLTAIARAADQTGLDTLWVADHLLQADPAAEVTVFERNRADGAIFEVDVEGRQLARLELFELPAPLGDLVVPLVLLLGRAGRRLLQEPGGLGP